MGLATSAIRLGRAGLCSHSVGYALRHSLLWVVMCGGAIQTERMYVGTMSACIIGTTIFVRYFMVNLSFDCDVIFVIVVVLPTCHTIILNRDAGCRKRGAL